MDTIITLQGFDMEVAPVLQIHDLLGDMYDILEKGISQKVGNAAHVLTFQIMHPGIVMRSQLHSLLLVMWSRTQFS